MWSNFTFLPTSTSTNPPQHLLISRFRFINRPELCSDRRQTGKRTGTDRNFPVRLCLSPKPECEVPVRGRLPRPPVRSGETLAKQEPFLCWDAPSRTGCYAYSGAAGIIWPWGKNKVNTWTLECDVPWGCIVHKHQLRVFMLIARYTLLYRAETLITRF
jgi:hypothetical protein